MRELDAQERGLQSVESRVDDLHDVLVLCSFAVVPQPPGSLDERRVARRHHSTVAVGAEVLARIEAEAGELAERAARASLVTRSVGLRSVFHGHEALGG